MHDVKFKLFQGALAYFQLFEGEWSQNHAEAGLVKEKWKVMTAKHFWSREEHRVAAECLDSVISASLERAGLGAIQLPAEYVAKGVTMLIDSRNWMSSAHFGRMYYSGTQAISENQAEAREAVSPESLYLLIIQSAAHDDARREGPQDLAELQVIEVKADGKKEK